MSGALPDNRLRPEPEMKHVILVAGSVHGRAVIERVQPLLTWLGKSIRFTTLELGAERYLRTGETLTDADLNLIRSSDALLIASPPVRGNVKTIPVGLLEHEIVFGLRHQLGLASNLRLFHGVGARQDLDVAVVREISEGLYFDPGTTTNPGTPQMTATTTSVTSQEAVERCLTFAFQLAAARRCQLVVAHKTAVLVAPGRIWTDTAIRLSADFPWVRLSFESIDTCCGELVVAPEKYDVIVTDNVFGDILADVAAAVTRAGDYTASVEFPDESGPCLFEPIHGNLAAPDPDRYLGMVAAIAAMANQVGLASISRELEARVRVQAAAMVEGRPIDDESLMEEIEPRKEPLQ